MTLTHSPMDSRVTARAFLFDDDRASDGAQAIGRALHRHGVAQVAFRGIRRLSSAALESVDDELGAVTEGLLDVDLGDALVAGWRRYSALTKSAERTVTTPGSKEVVVLAAHRVTGSYRPRVDLLVDNVRLNSFEFELSIVLEVTGLQAVVAAGDLVALRGGECLVTASLSLEGAGLAQRRQHVDLGLILRLDRPVPLVAKATQLVPQRTAAHAEVEDS